MFLGADDGRAKADGLGRWARSGILVGCGAGCSASASLAEVSELAVRRSEALGLCAVPFGSDGMEEEVSEAAARRSLSSWYLRRLSRGRTPFSR